MLPDVFPVPRLEQRFAFQRVYPIEVQKNLPAELQFPVTPDAQNPTGVEPIKPQPPTDAEVQAEAARVWATTFEPKVVKIGGKEINKETVQLDWQEWAGKLQSTMRQSVRSKTQAVHAPTTSAIAISKSIIQRAPAGPGKGNLVCPEQPLGRAGFGGRHQAD